MSERPSIFLDEKNAPILQRYERIAGLCAPVPTTMFVTSTEWARFTAELSALPAEIFTRPFNPSKATHSRFLIQTLTIVNSGTEDQTVCNAANYEAERKANFREKHDALAMRAGTKKVIEAEDTSSTHEVDPALIKETIRKEEIRRGMGAKPFVSGNVIPFPSRPKKEVVDIILDGVL